MSISSITSMLSAAQNYAANALATSSSAQSQAAASAPAPQTQAAPPIQDTAAISPQAMALSKSSGC